MARRGYAWLTVFAGGLIAAGCGRGTTDAPELVSDGSAARGKLLYTSGSGSSGPVVARLNDVPMPAAAVACANCHGPDGRGKAEGGVSPSAIDGDTLGRPAAPLGGRRRAAYDAAALGRAITAGIDPAGQRLNPTMPRYELAAGDVADLVAYLKLLGREPEPGVGDDVVRLGVLLPDGDPDGVRPVLTAYADQVNAAGGLFRRRVEWRFADLPAEPTRRAWAVRAFLDREPVFACVALPTAQPAAVTAAFEETGTPLVGPSPLAADGPTSPLVFSLYPSAGEQALALVVFAVEGVPAGTHRAVVVAAGDDPAADAVARRCEQAGCETEVVRSLPSDAGGRSELVRKWRADRRTLLFHLAPARDLPPLLAAGVAVGWQPTVLAGGAGVGAELFEPPAGFAGKVFLPLAVLPPADDSAAGRDYRRLTAGRPRTGRTMAADLSALTAARVLVEAVRRTGRELTRPRLVGSLEGLQRYETLSAPPVTFGPGRHVGTRGAYVMAADGRAKAVTPAGPWIDIDRPAERR